MLHHMFIRCSWCLHSGPIPTSCSCRCITCLVSCFSLKSCGKQFSCRQNKETWSKLLQIELVSQLWNCSLCQRKGFRMQHQLLCLKPAAQPSSWCIYAYQNIFEAPLELLFQIVAIDLCLFHSIKKTNSVRLVSYHQTKTWHHEWRGQKPRRLSSPAF